MSYPQDIDEMSDAKIIDEIARRWSLRQQYRCAYCRRVASECAQHPCAHPSHGTASYMESFGRIIHVIGRENTGGVLTIQEVIQVNVQRMIRWHQDGEPWNGADWGNALSGEGGELLEAALLAIQASAAAGAASNTVKKLRRHETHVGTSYNTPEFEELIGRLGTEVADNLLYGILLCNHYGIDFVSALINKFNMVSIAQNFPERLGLEAAPERKPRVGCAHYFEHSGVESHRCGRPTVGDSDFCEEHSAPPSGDPRTEQEMYDSPRGQR